MKTNCSLGYKQGRGFVVAVLSCLLLCLNGCASPPICSEQVHDTGKYLEVNGYVEKQLNEVFFKIFPDEIPSDTSRVSYCYEYECAVFGEPYFSISLKTAFESKDFYEAEKDKVLELDSACERNLEDAKYIFFLGEERDINEYLDDEVRDGQHFRFCFSILNDKEQSIEYIYADVYDGSRFGEEVKALLTPLLKP